MSSYSIRLPSLKFVGLAIAKIWLIFVQGLKWPVTLTFDLYMGSRVTRFMGFLLANFHLAGPYILDLGSCMEETDRQTDEGHQCIMPDPLRAGHNKCFHQYHLKFNSHSCCCC